MEIKPAVDIAPSASSKYIFLDYSDFTNIPDHVIGSLLAHELGHVLGIGIQGSKGELRAIRDSGGSLYPYVYGPRAVSVFRKYAPDAMAIPMHMDHMHWEFSGDIMSWNFGFFEDYAFRATDVSIAALVDAGLCLRGDDLGRAGYIG